MIPVIPDKFPATNCNPASTRSKARFQVYQTGYISIPADVFTGLWLGASEIARQYNFSIAGNFILENVAAPSAASFVACIRWRYADVVTRYKLWEDVDELLYVPLYEQQRIPANFSFEIWTVNRNLVGNESTITIPANYRLNTTLLRKNPTVCSDTTEYESSIGTACASIKADLPFDGTSETLDVGECSAHITN